MAWFQKEITISAKKRGCHLIQDELLAKVPEIKSFKVGTVHVFSRFLLLPLKFMGIFELVHVPSEKEMLCRLKNIKIRLYIG